jgi:peptidoglycan hydrolase-like protein with peptidoglycan-binding domain
MRISSIRNIVSATLMLATLPAFARPHGHVTLRHGATKLHKSVKSSAKAHESYGMPSERATEIQTALTKQGYLSGEPSGAWDSQTSAAMAKFQADNGWQSKITPDSRALIKLGLGPQAPSPDQVVSSKNN